jgi:hypothetical protein
MIEELNSWEAKPKEVIIDIHAPSQLNFLISLILAALAVVAHFVAIPYATEYQFWLAVAGYVVLVASCLAKM